MPDLFLPSAFKRDPYGWLTNQTGHVFLGVVLAYLICLGWLVMFGEYPVRAWVWGVILAGYLCFELFGQGWRGWDTAEDTIFVVAYGAGGALFPFHEVTPGSPEVTADMAAALPFFYACLVHLFAGVTHRPFSGKSSSKE